MRIANPIYDAVFKYLMEDREAAILLLSTLLDEEITELEFHPQERTAEIPRATRFLSVYRLDFAAEIRLKQGGCRKGAGRVWDQGFHFVSFRLVFNANRLHRSHSTEDAASASRPACSSW